MTDEQFYILKKSLEQIETNTEWTYKLLVTLLLILVMAMTIGVK